MHTVRKKVLVVLMGGTALQKGSPLEPMTAGEAAEFMKKYLRPFGIQYEIKFIIAALSKLWDSGDTQCADIKAAAMKIARRYKEIDGVIVICGTGRAARIVAGLSLVFRKSLRIPILVNGSLQAPQEAEGDFHLQIKSTTKAINWFMRTRRVVGVHFVWRHAVLHGARLMKVSDAIEPAFVTPGRFPIATISSSSDEVYVESHAPLLDLIMPPAGFELHTQFSLKVQSDIQVTADDNPWLLRMMANSGLYDAVILNVADPPSRPFPKRPYHSWEDAIRHATQKGMLVCIVFPWQPSRVNLDKYRLGKKAKRAGAEGMGSLTPAMAEMKLRQGFAENPGIRRAVIEFLRTEVVDEFMPGSGQEGQEES